MILQTTHRRARYLTTDDVMVLPSGERLRVTDVQNAYAGSVTRVTLRRGDGSSVVERFHADGFVTVLL